jgi:hypothetical protein
VSTFRDLNIAGALDSLCDLLETIRRRLFIIGASNNKSRAVDALKEWPRVLTTHDRTLLADIVFSSNVICHLEKLTATTLIV